MKKFFSILVALILLSSILVYAQEQTGEIIGTVKDAEGSPLPGVTIEARSPTHLGAETTVTDDMGRFRLIGLTPGTYTITFSLPRFSTLIRKGIIVRLGKTFNLNVTLTQAAIEEEITVVGESPVVDIKKSSTTVNIGKEMFAKLPKGRDFTSIVTVAAGVNDEPMLGGTSMDGASGSENMFFIDGVDTTSMYTGASAQQVLFEFIEEVQVKSSGYEAEYGGSMGGVINVITRSGGNEFHGEATIYYRSDELQGGRRPSLRINPLDNTKAEYITYPEDNWTQYEVGFGLGGYILKDRLWFFSSIMPRFTRTERTVEFIADGKEHTTTQNRYYYFGQFKLTAQPFSGLRISTSFVNDFNKWKGDLAPLSGAGNPDKEWSIYGFNYPGWTAAARADYIASDSLFFTLSGGYFRTNTKQLVGPDGPRYFFLATNADIPGVPPNLVRARYWYNYGYYDGYQTAKDTRTRITGNWDFTYFFDAGGEHVIKGGVQMVRLGQDVDNAYPYDYNRLYWGRSFQSPSKGTVPTTYGYREVREPFGVIANIRSLRWAIFLQDSWTIGNRLTLNFGFRAEKEDIPSFSDLPEYQNPPIKFSFSDKIAPRFGFAYDVFGDNNLKIFGSVGLYYDVMKLEMAEGSYGGFKWISHYYDIKTLDWTQFAEATHPDTSNPNLYKYIESLNWRIPSFETTQPDMKPYSKIEYTAGLQKKLGEDFSLTVRFLYNRIIWAIEDIGMQTPEGEQYYNGNPGSAWIQELYDKNLGPEYPDCPKAKRKYYSLSIGFDKRYSNNWMGGIHYTWSYLWGNFSGLASSDEFGRMSPNVERYFDAWMLHRDQNLKETTGKLPTDRPHQLKVYGSYTFDFGLTVGFYTYAMSGTPVSRMLAMNYLQGYYPVGRFSDDRTPFLTRSDLYLEYNLKLGGKYGFQINANITNLFNQKIAQRKYSYYNQQTIFLSDAELLAGYDYQAVVARENIQLDPRFLMPYSYTPSIDIRLGIKFIF